MTFNKHLETIPLFTCASNIFLYTNKSLLEFKEFTK